MDSLTHSRIDCFKACRRKHWIEYEQKIRRSTEAKALRMGSIWHDCMEVLVHQGLKAALEHCIDSYADREAEADLALEREILFTLIRGYHWRWIENEGSQIAEYLCTEQQFRMPIRNPETGAPTPVFELEGKIDGIVRLHDDRIAVLERKLLGEDISNESFLWRRLRIDQQITVYCIGAKQLGYEVDCVLYEPTRKPTIRPCQVPELDEDGIKIVLDREGNRVRTKDGKKWRQTGDTELGYELQARTETPDEFAARLVDDLQNRPDFYFCQREVPRLASDIEEFEAELWQIQQSVRESQRCNRWFRSANRNTCEFCSVFDLCTSGSFEPGREVPASLPEGFVFVDSIHQELV